MNILSFHSVYQDGLGPGDSQNKRLNLDRPVSRHHMHYTAKVPMHKFVELYTVSNSK